MICKYIIQRVSVQVLNLLQAVSYILPGHNNFFKIEKHEKEINKVNLHECWSVVKLSSESNFDKGASNSCGYKKIVNM